MAIIEKDRHRLSEPSRGEDEINSMVAIDIPRFDCEPARRCDELNCLSSDRGKLESDPVVSRGGADLAALDTSKIGTLIPIEVSNRY